MKQQYVTAIEYKLFTIINMCITIYFPETNDCLLFFMIVMENKQH